MGYRVGVDIGGSFTDFALFDEATQSLKTLKVFSRPDEPGAEVLEGVRLVGERYGIRPEEISYFTHGTTVGINTVIQRKGLRLALFTTEHFRAGDFQFPFAHCDRHPAHCHLPSG